MGKALMIQGTGSHVGKSLLVAGLCRAALWRGLSVRPFKPQNMSNNAAVTADGGEIGRAQALQARACKVEPLTDMNPVLLKPETETGAQVVLRGTRIATLRARDYARLKPSLLPAVLESFGRLRAAADLVIVEGAGSPAEINLREGDIANMGFALAAGLPVVLAGDIDRGGVIAQIVGTHAVLPPGDRAAIAGFVINKLRGDASLFADGLGEIVARTGWPSFGILPWFAEAQRLPAEDAQEIRSAGAGPVKIAVPLLSRIANFDDLDPLRLEPGLTVEMVRPGQPLPAESRLVILPGSKSTIGDLGFLREQGWDIDLLAHHRRGGRILGICGGYQMLGRVIRDPGGIEGPPGEVRGLGLLDVETVMTTNKTLSRVAGIHPASGTAVRGYEIHIGITTGPDCARPWLEIAGRREGAADATGRVQGCYLHGLFASDLFRAAYLGALGAAPAPLAYEAEIDATLDRLAEHVEAHLDVPGLLALAR
ncbi:MAG TPA: cobyric acid synthase [Paracoccaceae bacterium]|nr:cobyric acid synthase [Paracoccaceae bacterium]